MNEPKPNPPIPTKGLELWACEWEDAHYNSGEFERHEVVHRPVNYITVGIILRNDETGISMASDICEAGTFRGMNFIPRKMVVRAWKVGHLSKVAYPKKKSKTNSPADPTSHSNEDMPISGPA